MSEASESTAANQNDPERRAAEPLESEANEADSEYVIPTEGSDSTGERAVEEIAPDLVLLAARDQARAALAEITDAQTIGSEDGHEAHEAHVVTLYFECRLPGYPGWRWAATLARVDEDSDINVLEVELLPGAGAVTAPEWVPWSQRLAQYRETQSRQAIDEAAAAEEAAAELADEDEIDPEDDLLENDFSDFDDEIDGVDIDEEGDDEDDDSDGDDESDDELDEDEPNEDSDEESDASEDE